MSSLRNKKTYLCSIHNTPSYVELWDTICIILMKWCRKHCRYPSGTLWVGLNSERNIPFAKGSYFYEMKFLYGSNKGSISVYIVFVRFTTKMKSIYVFKLPFIVRKTDFIDEN